MGRKCVVPGCRSGYADIGARAKEGSGASGGQTSDPVEDGAGAVGDTRARPADREAAQAQASTGPLSFHIFPKDPELRRKWVQSIPRDK